MLERISLFFYGAALVTLPMSGVGLLFLLTGRDWGFGLQPSWFFLYLAVGLQVVQTVFGRQTSARSRGLLVFGSFTPTHRVLLAGLVLVLLVLGISGFGIMLAPSGESAGSAWGRFLRQVVQVLIMLGYVIWPALWTRGGDRWRFTWRMLVTGAVLQVGYGLLQQWHYFHPGTLLPLLEKVFTSNPAILSGSEELYLGNAFLHVPRLRGTMCEPLYLGNYLLMVLPWVVWGRRWCRCKGVALGAMGLLLLLTWSRGAWISLVFQVLVMGVIVVLRAKSGSPGGRFNPGRRFFAAGSAVLLLILAGLVFSDLPFFQLPRDRLVQTFSSQDWSNLTRLYSMQAAWRAFLLSPLVGVGWGQYSFHFPLLVDPLGLQSQFSWPVVNNFPLKILCETGGLGLVVFLGLAGWLLVSGWKKALRATGPRVAGVLAALVAVLGVWVQLFTFSQYNLPHIWLAVGLMLAVLYDEQFPDPGLDLRKAGIHEP